MSTFTCRDPFGTDTEVPLPSGDRSVCVDPVRLLRRECGGVFAGGERRCAEGGEGGFEAHGLRGGGERAETLRRAEELA